MSVDRVATNTQTQYMLNQIANANANLSKSQSQVSSGNKADDYAGYGDQTAAMEAARSAAARAGAYQASTNLAVAQASLQDTQLNTLSSLADQLRQAVTDTVSSNDGSSLMDKVQSIYSQAVDILNSKDANGNYLFGGDKNDTAPVTATTLAALDAAPSAASVFANGKVPATVNTGDGQTVTVGVLASDAGTQLFQTIKNVLAIGGAGGANFTTQLDSTTATSLSSEIATAKSAATSVNNVMAVNGNTYNQLKDAADHQSTLADLYKGFTSDIQDVDMATAITNLNANQTALQAALQVTAQLNQVSLLNYLK